MNKQQIIDAAMSIASNIGTDAHDSPVVDNEMAVEDLLPIAHKYVYFTMLKENPARRQDLLQEHLIGITDGVGDFPSDIITEFIEESFLPDFKYSSFAQFLDFKRQRFDNLLCYWTENKGKFYTTCTNMTSGSGSEEESGSEEVDETIKLHAITIPALPANATDEVQMSPRDLETLIYTLALAIRGELKLTIG